MLIIGKKQKKLLGEIFKDSILNIHSTSNERYKLIWLQLIEDQSTHKKFATICIISSIWTWAFFIYARNSMPISGWVV